MSSLKFSSVISGIPNLAELPDGMVQIGFRGFNQTSDPARGLIDWIMPKEDRRTVKRRAGGGMAGLNGCPDHLRLQQCGTMTALSLSGRDIDMTAGCGCHILLGKQDKW